jgi:hypothetical protein
VTIFAQNYKLKVKKRKMIKTMLRILALCITLNSCATLQNPSKYELANGLYQLKKAQGKQAVYVENEADSLAIFDVLTQNKINKTKEKMMFETSAFDLDVVTILFKIRPANSVLPTQINTDFNGSFYGGFRRDIYSVQEKRNPINQLTREINHFGFGVGFFSGVGATAVNSSTTNNAIQTEYDGVVWQNGVAGIFAVNKLTLGISLGLDHLFDTNKDAWIYQNKAWLGLVIGLNLN